MATFEVILLLAAAVLVSAVVEQLLPKISIPLVQAGIGVVIALLASQPVTISFNPDFFLLVFIAPILFHDAKGADKLALWRNRGYIVSLAIGLVVAITLIVGFTLHFIVPSVPLTAAFALGAALGPTDAVAVLSLKKVAQLNRRESALLAGEALINDASGVVTFQFAVAATVTGAFSLAEASLAFVVSFFGGIVLGLALGWLAHFIQDKVDDLGLDANTFHVLFDVMLPFIIYLIAELVGVSGVLAVVAAGLLLSVYTDRAIGPSAARLSIVSSNVWGVIEFTLNGIVFVLLGLQLPRGMRDALESSAISNFTLLALVVSITVVLVLVRFIWVLVGENISRDPDTGEKDTPSDRVRSALVTTIGGPKGAVTLSIIMSTPFFTDSWSAFPQRSLLIFIASGVIVFTLLLANFLLPLLAPNTEEHREDPGDVARAQLEILRTVIDRLAASRTKENSRAVGTVISSYNERIERLQDEADIESESSDALRIAVTERQEERLFEMIDSGEVDEVEGYAFIRNLERTRSYLKHKSDDRKFVFTSLRHRSTLVRAVRLYFRRIAGKIPGYDKAALASEVRNAADRIAIEYLQELSLDEEGTYPSEVVARVLLSYQRSLRMRQSGFSLTTSLRVVDNLEDVQRKAYNFELEEVRAAANREEISRQTAKRMRDNVYLMLVDLDADMEMA